MSSTTSPPTCGIFAGPAERRLLELHPEAHALRLSLETLARAVLIEWIDDDEIDFALSEEARLLDAAIHAFLGVWGSGSGRAYLAAAIGDWLAAHAAALAAGDVPLIAATGPRAEACRWRRLAAIRRQVDRRGLHRERLHALADAVAEDLPDYVRQALRRPGEATKAALDRVVDLPDYVADVERLVEAILTDEHRWVDHLLVACAEYLARHGRCTRELIETLAGSRVHEFGDAAVLALEHAPDLAPDLLRRALRAKYHPHRLTAAAGSTSPGVAASCEPSSTGRTTRTRPWRAGRRCGRAATLRPVVPRPSGRRSTRNSGKLPGSRTAASTG